MESLRLQVEGLRFQADGLRLPGEHIKIHSAKPTPQVGALRLLTAGISFKSKRLEVQGECLMFLGS